MGILMLGATAAGTRQITSTEFSPTPTTSNAGMDHEYMCPEWRYYPSMQIRPTAPKARTHRAGTARPHLPYHAEGVVLVASVLLFFFSTATARAQAARTLDIYWIDVEGGAATLVVSPSGESLLYDAGWEVDGRDAKRIFAAAQQAGLKKIDHFVLSHYHADHAGGIPALAKLIPIGHCYDRGDFIEPANQRWRDAYLSACADKRTILKAGDKIPLKDVSVDVVASNGDLLTKPIGGGRPNPLCATAENRPKEGPENQFMVGALFTYGKFKFIDLADLDWEKEMELA